MSEAALWIDPGRRSGAPCIYGTRLTVEHAAHLVDVTSVAEYMVDYDVESRRNVLAACAWWTLWYPRKYATRADRAQRKRWVDWAEQAWADLRATDGAHIPDPPKESL